MIRLRQDQEDVRAKLRVALRQSSSVLAFAPTGFGKCLGRDTPVMMHDGTVKMVQDVAVGDMLMGPDSKPRRVLSTCRGREMLYRVTPRKGDAYVVNESHILSLKMTRGTKHACYPDGSIQNVEVREYLKRSKTFKHCAKGWRVGVDFAKHDDDAPVDPYFLGLWLGDGNSRKPCVTTQDFEIATYCANYFESIGLWTRLERNSDNSTNIHGVNAKNEKNVLLDALRAIGVIKNKHIPHRYKTGSRDERLQVLAGLIDTDGHFSSRGAYEFTLKDERLTDDLLFIARSLGFAANKVHCQKTCGNNGVRGDYFRTIISGNIDEIPVRLPRKMAYARLQKKDVLTVGIRVDQIGEGDYYGFEIDGDRLFLLGDFTVTHNTVLAGALIQLLFNAKKRVIFAVHRIDLIKQTAGTFEKFGIPFSYIAAGHHYNPYHRVYIASILTLKNRLGKIPADYIFVDEAHLSAAAGWAAVAAHYKSTGAKLIGLTGSPERLDGKPLGDVWDEMVMGPTVRWLIENGHLSRYRAFAPKGVVDTSGLHTRKGEFVQAEVDALMEGKAVIAGAVKHWRAWADGLRTIAFCPSVARAKEYADEFSAQGIPSVALDAETPQHERVQAFADFADRKLMVIFNCALFCEGFDLAAQVNRDVTIECVMQLSPTQSLAKHLQQLGRGLRKKPDAAILLDLVGNIERLGLPDDDREWTLEGRKKVAREVKAVTCDECFATHPPAPACPECGFKYPKKEAAGGGRHIEEVDHDLEEIDVEAVRRQRAAEQAQARTLEDLIALATARGYKSPQKWAAHVYTARQARVVAA